MKKLIVFLLAICLMIPAVVSAASKEQIVEWNNSVVRVQACSDDMYCWTGTGFVIKGGYIVTNAHIVNDADLVRVRAFWGLRYDVEVVAFDAQSDLAILKADAPVFSYSSYFDLKLDETLKINDEEYTIIGHTKDKGGWYLSTGKITMFKRYTALKDHEYNGTGQDRIDYEVMHLDAPIDFGNSGSPVIDSDGNVIGVVEAKDQNDRAIASTPSSLLKLLKDYEKDAVR